MRDMRRLLLPVLASTVLLAACGSDDESGTSESTPATGSGDRVVMQDLKFVPRDITVDVGDTITWVNEDSAPHNVVNAQEGQEPKSELFNKGGTYEFTPDKPGRIEYVCTIHPGMDGTITVK